MRIESVRADHYRIPLPRVLSDSTHGEMSHFELVTVRRRKRFIKPPPQLEKG